MAAHELTITEVPVDDLHQDPKNPRRITQREMDRLKRSITEDPDFMRLRPILARPDGSVYAGNMRLEAARALKWATVPAIVTDDPEAVLRKRAVKDNTQFGEWVEEELAEYLDELGKMEADYDFGSLGLDDALVRTMGLEAQADLAEMRFDTGPDTEPGTSVAGVERPFPAEADDTIRSLDDAPDELKGALKLAEDVVYAGADAEPTFDIPLLRTDRFIDAVPPGLETWAGGDAGQDAPWYLYNYSPHKTTTNAPLDQSMLAFFTEDRFFLPWWSAPAYYVGKMLNAGVTLAVEPDFSLAIDWPKVLNIFNLYRARWLARYMQDAGIRVLPRVPYPFPGCEYMMAGYPAEAPVVALNCQTPGKGATKLERTHQEDSLVVAMELALSQSAPKQVLLYGAAIGTRVRERVQWGDVEPVLLDNFLAERRKRGLPYRES